MKKIFYLFFFVLIANITFPQTDEITLEDLLIKGKYRTQSIGQVIHLNDGEHFTMMDSAKNIVEYEYATGKQTKIILSMDDFVSVSGFSSASTDDYSFIPDSQYFLLATAS